MKFINYSLCLFVVKFYRYFPLILFFLLIVYSLFISPIYCDGGDINEFVTSNNVESDGKVYTGNDISLRENSKFLTLFIKFKNKIKPKFSKIWKTIKAELEKPGDVNGKHRMNDTNIMKNINRSRRINRDNEIKRFNKMMNPRR